MSNGMSDLFEDDRNEGVEVSDLKLGRLGELANTLIELRAEMAVLAEKLAAVTLQAKELSERQIPDLMEQLGGMERITVRGWTIHLKKIYAASIPEANREQAFAWLGKHGHADIIKNDVTTKFGKGQDELADNLVAKIKELGFEAEQKKYVHPQTLKAFVREQIEKGVDFPQETFGVYTGYITDIKRG